jgi:two-component system, OmpR family, sensor histidine kinase MprB
VSLRARMGLASGVAVALAVIAVAVVAYAATRSNLLGQVDQSLNNITHQYLNQANSGHGGPGGPFPGGGGSQGPGGGSPPRGALGGDCDRGLGINYGPPNQPFGGARGYTQLVTPSGTVCRGTSETTELPVSDQTKAIAQSQHGSYFTDMTVNGDDIRVLVSGVPGYGALMVALPLSTVDHTLSDQRLLLAVIAAGGIALAAIAANPERIETDRLEVTGSDDLARLGRTFNATLDALENSLQSQRNLVADASHELRTPIATIRANLQLMRDEALLTPEDREALRADVIEELDELTALVGDVVELARGSKPSAAQGDVRLDQIVSQAVDRTRRRAPQLTVQAQVEPTLVRGEGDRIARAVANLLDNASKVSPDGGVIEVDLHAGTLTVRDHGPGFHEEDLPFIFDRFHRARDARSKPGSGLGLAIVRQAAEAHGGFVEASNAAGGGALLRIGFGPPIPLEESLLVQPTSAKL